jgi:hypothetical protein
MLKVQIVLLLPIPAPKHQSTSQRMHCKLPFCVIVYPLLGKRGVDWMSARRTKVHFKAIHISIPIRLLEDFDETLRFNQSRSKKIASLIANELNEQSSSVADATTRELFAALSGRNDVDMLMKSLILQVLSQ